MPRSGIAVLEGAPLETDYAASLSQNPIYFRPKGASDWRDCLFGETAARTAASKKTLLTSFLFANGMHFHAPLDEAEATSTYEGGPGTGAPLLNMFHSRRALTPGTGYWCSTGDHRPNDMVSWSAKLHRRRQVSGIKLSWAYSPGEVRVRASPDGVHWNEVVGWHKPKDGEVSFEEDMLFDRARNVMAVSVDMRHPRPWNFFGINQAVLVL